MAKRKSVSKGKTPKKVNNNKENEEIEETVVPDIDEDEEADEGQYEVEDVVDKRKRNGKIEYLIKWKDYGEEDNTWELLANLDCPELIDQYEEKSKSSAAKTSPKSSRRSGPLALTSKAGQSNSSRDSGLGFARALVAEKIIGVTENEGSLLYLIQWEGGKEADLVPANVAIHKCPHIVIQFFQERLHFNKPK